MNEQALQEYVDKHEAIVAKVREANPGLPYITATILASDLMSAERATEEVANGVPAERAVWMVGSYARWEWVLQMVAQGVLSEQWFQDNICELWASADPDDTNPAYLAVWRKARATAGSVIRDGRPLPHPKRASNEMLRVYRGGMPFGLRDGFAWTTDPKIAQKFANGAGVRVEQVNGVVISGLVKRRDVMAYITGRGESEVIVDPRLVSRIKPGSPLMSAEDETLDKVIALWKQADEHTGKADFLSDEANREQQIANDLEDQAEALWMPLADAHPEWFDALHVGEDPRISESEARALDGNR